MGVRDGKRLLQARWVLLGLLVALFAVNDLTIAVTQLMAPHAGRVDFHVYFSAAQALAHGRSPYITPPPCCFNPHAMSGYTYPPLFAFILIPLTRLSLNDAGRIWLAVNYASLVGVLLIGVRTARSRMAPETIAWLALVMLASPQIGAAMYGIQVDPLVLLLEAVFAWSVVTNRVPAVGGAALALAVCIKVSPVFIAPAIFLLPRDRALQALGGMASGLVAGGLAMLAISGQTVYYFTHVLPSFSGGVINQWDRSLPGVVLRTLDSQGLHPTSELGTTFLALEVVALLGVWVACSRVPGASGRLLTVAGLLSVTPIFQGVTWDHHLIVEILVLILLVPLLHAGSLAWILAVGGELVTGVNQQIVDRWLAARGLEPPHGSAQVILFIAAASIDLIGMVATLSAVLVLARRLSQRDPVGRRVEPRVLQVLTHRARSRLFQG
ncbi:MAG: glycosyltransferase family 87 protein [Candidatus Dormibacteria bacterium]